MTDIASNVERIIDKLDGMTTEVVPKTYGTDIASKVEHIAKQLDYVQSGGGSGGESGGESGDGGDIFKITFRLSNNDSAITADKTFEEIMQSTNENTKFEAVLIPSSYPEQTYGCSVKLVFDGYQIGYYSGGSATPGFVFHAIIWSWSPNQGTGVNTFRQCLIVYNPFEVRFKITEAI